MSNERAELEAMRLIMIGSATEAGIKEEFDTACEDLRDTIKKHGDIGKLALALVAAEVGLEN